MSLCFGTDSDNDLYLGPDGNLVLLSGILAVEAACAMAAKSILGEQVLSINAGVPDFQTIWNGSPKYALYQASLRRTLQNVPGVTSVEEIQISLEGDSLQYIANITTAFGSGQVTSG